MKKFFLLSLLSCFISLLLMSQADNPLVSIKLKNTSSSGKKVAVISYSPGEGGNGTQVFSLRPGRQQELQFKTGTKIYIANSRQTDSVMSGKRIDAGQPFLIIKSTDNQKTFNLQ